LALLLPKTEMFQIAYFFIKLAFLSMFAFEVPRKQWTKSYSKRLSITDNQKRFLHSLEYKSLFYSIIFTKISQRLSMLKYLEAGVHGIDLKPSYPFIGSTIRGAFGYALRQVYCPYIGVNCEECGISERCVYNEFFENVSDTPNFRLDIDLDQKSFDFKILLFERAVNYLSHITIAIQNMQEIGLGANRSKFKFTHLSLNGKVAEPKFLLSNAPETLNFTPDFTAGDYEISLQTPLRIKQKNVLVRRDIDFKSFTRQIAMRFESITGESMDKFEVKFDRFEQDLRFYDINRYSNRQHAKMQFGGMIGKMRVFGLDERSAKLLQLACITGVGKSTVFGLGKIKVDRI
jgi:conserved hypothetical protein